MRKLIIILLSVIFSCKTGSMTAAEKNEVISELNTIKTNDEKSF